MASWSSGELRAWSSQAARMRRRMIRKAMM
jgi:hypothetical protein